GCPGVAARMRTDHDLGLAQAGFRAYGAEPAFEQSRLVRRDIRRGAEVDDRRAASPVACGLDGCEETVEVRRSDDLDLLRRDTLKLVGLARLCFVPDEQTVGVLV